MKFIKIILSVLLLVCLMDMPYGYFQFVRFISAVGFSYLAYREHEEQNEGLMIVYIVLVVLFQPFYKIALGRELWNIVDVLVAAFLIVTLFINRKR